MGDLGGSPVPGAEGTTEGLAPPAILDPMILRFAVLTYLVVLPVGHLVAIPVNGMMARGTDVFLALVLLAAIVDIGRMIGPYLTREGGGVSSGTTRLLYRGALYRGLQRVGGARCDVELVPGLCSHQGSGFRGVGHGRSGHPVVRRSVGRGGRCVAPGDPDLPGGDLDRHPRGSRCASNALAL